MKQKIGVLGGSSKSIEKSTLTAAREIGRQIAKKNFILLTGASTGVPYEAAKGAKENSGLVIGISPAINQEEHTKKFTYPTDVFDCIIYTGFGRKGRNVILVRSAEAVVLIDGKIGTLNEFTIAYDEGKVIGVLEGSGQIADYIKEIIKTANKETEAQVLYDRDPKNLIEKIRKNLG